MCFAQFSDLFDPYQEKCWILARTPETKGALCNAFPGRDFRVTVTFPLRNGPCLRILFEIAPPKVIIWSVALAPGVTTM
jgi:hypothetical protein